MAPRIVFLFGAGASYGAGGMMKPPPLGNRLFSDLAAAFPHTWGALPSEFDEEFRKGFEVGIEACYGKYLEMAALLNRMGRYFVLFNIDSFADNLYYGLVNRFWERFASGEFAISTINYECLIELAVAGVFGQVAYWGKSDAVRVLKLHGSCNFFAGNVFVSKNVKQFNLNTARIVAPLRSLTLEEALHELEVNQMPPAMSLYAREKANIVAEPTIKLIQAEFHEAVKNAQHVIVVGTRPYPDDRHVWDHLRKTDASLVMVGGEEDCTSWLQANRRGKPDRWLSDRFNESFEEICRILET
jgi:hypothetical protein